MRKPRYGLSIALVFAAACHNHSGAMSQPNGAASPTGDTRTDTSAQGVVRVVGSAPAPVVTLTSDTVQVSLVGPLAAELANLDGARINVSGPVGKSQMPLGRASRAITVRRYKILEVAGGTPVVGVLVADGSGAFRVDTLLLSSPPPDLTRFVGSKVWVVGKSTDSGALTVQAFGILTQAPTAPRPE